jgi:mono/diheme cytochrome c family protein
MIAPLRLMVLFWAGVLLCGCGSARRGEPFTGPLVLSEEAQRGQVLFMRHCHQCHPGGEAGLAPAINDKPLPGFLTRFQVRHGLGAMPAFSKDDIGDAEVDAIVAYLSALKQQPRVRTVAAERTMGARPKGRL